MKIPKHGLPGTPSSDLCVLPQPLLAPRGVLLATPAPSPRDTHIHSTPAELNLAGAPAPGSSVSSAAVSGARTLSALVGAVLTPGPTFPPGAPRALGWLPGPHLLSALHFSDCPEAQAAAPPGERRRPLWPCWTPSVMCLCPQVYPLQLRNSLCAAGLPLALS